MGYIKFTGCKQNGDGMSGNINIAIKNPSSVSVLIDELPIDLCYKGAKVTILDHFSFYIIINTQPDHGHCHAHGQHYISLIVK